jgi:uncharacterized membrane protein YdjX (TVP38/TMEM64 family)
MAVCGTFVTEMQQFEGDQKTPKRSRVRCPSPRHLLPVLVLVAGLAAYFGFGLHHFVTLEALREHHDLLTEWVHGYGLVSGLCFAALYAAAVALSIPGASLMTIAAGLMFGPYLATVFVVFGATIGATILFLAARYAFCDFLRAKAGGVMDKMAHGFNENPLSYMLILRLVPLFPFWLVNLVPAFLGVSLTTFMISTFFGIIPGTFVYALLGDGAGAILHAGEDLDLGIIFEPRFLAPLIGLGILAVIPVAYKMLKRRGKPDHG